MTDPATPAPAPRAMPLGSVPTDTPDTILIPSTTRAQVETLLRYLLMAAGAILTALGFTHAAGAASLLLLAIGPVASLIAYVMGVLKVRADAQRMADLQARVPNSIARTLVQ